MYRAFEVRTRKKGEVDMRLFNAIDERIYISCRYSLV